MRGECIKKAFELMVKAYTFVLNFETIEWHKYVKPGGVVVENAAWPDVLQVNLPALL